MAIAENTTHLLSSGGVVDYGKTLKDRWADIISPPKEEPVVDDRPAEEIASDIWARIRGK